MANVYDQHRAHFANVSAFVILRGREVVGTVALKFPRDGAGRLYAYVHFLGMPMVRGYAGGYGYDKRSAAVTDAMRKIDLSYFTPDHYGNSWAKERKACEKFRNSVVNGSDGRDWADLLRDAGYTVAGAV